MKNNSKKLVKKNLEYKKYLKEKMITCMLNWKDMMIRLIVGLIKRPYIKVSQYFPKPFRSFGGNINVKVDLSNYATKTDLKNVTHVDTSSFALKTNLANLKTEVHKLDIDKLAPVPVDLSKLSDVVKNDVAKKAVYDKLVPKVNNLDTSDFVLKTKYQTDKTELEKKIPGLADFVKKTKLSELENKIPEVVSLSTKTALTVVKTKIPDISSLVRKTDYNKKISELKNKLFDHNHDKYSTTTEFNTMTASVFNARLAQVNLITKADFDAKLSSLNRKNTSNKTKHFLVENELKKIKTFNSSYFIGKSQFEENDTQNYLVFQPMYRYFKRFVGVGTGNYIYFWKSRGLSDENITAPTTSDYGVNPQVSYYGTKAWGKFDGSCWKQEKVAFNHGKVVHIYIVYEITKIVDFSGNNNRPKIENALFRTVSLTKNADTDKYKYSGYGTRFDRRSRFSHPSGEYGQNVTIFGVDISSSTKIDNRKKKFWF